MINAMCVGSDANSLIFNPLQAFTYANFSDAVVEEDTGFINAI